MKYFFSKLSHVFANNSSKFHGYSSSSLMSIWSFCLWLLSFCHFLHSSTEKIHVVLLNCRLVHPVPKFLGGGKSEGCSRTLSESCSLIHSCLSLCASSGPSLSWKFPGCSTQGMQFCFLGAVSAAQRCILKADSLRGQALVLIWRL